MILRTSASVFFAALLATAPFGAAANAQTAHHSATHHRSAHHAMHARSGMARNTSGHAATDALNEQSLNSARNGTDPSMSGSTPASGPASAPAQ